MNIKLLIFLSLLFPSISHGGVLLSYGIDFPHDGVDVLIFSSGYEDNIAGAFSYKAEGGGWIDRRHGISGGSKSSGYGSFSLGFSVRPSFLYASAFWGAGGITHTDSVLGGAFSVL